MTVHIKPEKLIDRGALDFGNSDFRLMKTTCCNAYIVYEYEAGHIYYDSNDLKKVCLEFSIDRCPICSAGKWDFIDTDDSKIPSNWSWAF